MEWNVFPDSVIRTGWASFLNPVNSCGKAPKIKVVPLIHLLKHLSGREDRPKQVAADQNDLIPSCQFVPADCLKYIPEADVF